MSLVVKAHHPWKTRLFLLFFAAMLVAGGWALFEYGRFSAGYDAAEVSQTHGVLLDLVDELEGRIEGLREEKAVLERAAQIERKAYDELDTTLKVLQAEILELKEELAFYRGIVSPRDAAQGLHLQRFRIEPNGKSQGYRYKIILTQILKDDRTARGRIQFTIEGLHNNETRVLGLEQVAEKPVKELDYSFRYFQNLEGDLKLPADFKPQRVTIRVVPHRSSGETIEKTFDWPDRK